MSTPLPVALTRRLEESTALDPVVRAVRPVAGALVAKPLVRDVLQGAWLGHALHPLMTDAPIGFWASATVLDLVGGPDARPSSQRLLGLGLLLAGPTAWTGWAEWTDTGQREQREVHAVEHRGGIVTDLDLGQRGEGAVVELHHDPLEGLQRRGDLQQAQLDRGVLAQQVAAGEAEQQAVADLAGGAGDGDLDG